MLHTIPQAPAGSSPAERAAIADEWLEAETERIRRELNIAAAAIEMADVHEAHDRYVAGDGPRPFNAHTFAYRVIAESVYDNQYEQELVQRITAIEEVIAARPLRRLLLLVRLSRRIRRSVAPYAWAGPTFEHWRTEQLGNDWLCR
jgi:hypothetical protein